MENKTEDQILGEKIIDEANYVDIENAKWRTKTGEYVRMMDMEEKHLANCFFTVCLKEAEAFNRNCVFSELRDQLEAVAKARGIVVEYPDVKFPSRKYSKYFDAIRKQKEETSTIILASSEQETKNKQQLEQKDTNLD